MRGEGTREERKGKKEELTFAILNWLRRINNLHAESGEWRVKRDTRKGSVCVEREQQISMRCIPHKSSHTCVIVSRSY